MKENSKQTEGLDESSFLEVVLFDRNWHIGLGQIKQEEDMTALYAIGEVICGTNGVTGMVR